MANVDTGLTNLGSGRGVTTHFAFKYDDALNSTAHPGQPEPARTNALIGSIEGDYNLMAGWFNNIALPFGLPIAVNVANAGGGAGWGPPITLSPGGGDANLMRYLMVAEVTEMFMLAQNQGWFAPDGSNEQSTGEGLSHFLATQFLLANGLAPFNDISNLWLNSARADWVNNTDQGDHSSGPKSGCALLFLYYLNTQLGFSINQIVGAAATTMAGVYRNLTGDNLDPFPFFKYLLDVAFPGTSTISGRANLDNPYPLGLLSFWTDKSTFGRDEVQDVINTSGGVFPEAFWLVLEGFSIDSFNSLGVQVSALSGSFATRPGIAISRNPGPIDFENAANPKAPQRIRIAYDITFTNAALASFPAAGTGPSELELDAHLQIGGNRIPASDAGVIFELVSGADPYFTNIDPAQDNVFWLSQDLRVFTATPGQNGTPVAGGPVFGSDNVAGAFAYLQALLGHLNSTYSNPGGTDPFATVLPGQGGALTGDSSVTPLTVDLSNPFNPRVYANYNFAVARVRLRGTAGAAGAASNVRVFFRLWSTQTADTDYQPASTYLASPDAAGQPGAPLTDSTHHTLPFFATGNLGANSDYGPGGANIRTIQIPSGDAVWAYFGCFLNVYDAGNIVDGQTVQHWLNGTHHCLVAQIAYDDAPIVNANGLTKSPENSDKLAQRNLQVTHSDNPGPADTHVVPQTFDTRPSGPTFPAPGTLMDIPDELMFDWGGVPVGSTASIYWPQVDASEVLALAGQLYGSHALKAADAHTVSLQVPKGVSYVPIPTGGSENYAGLLTIDLPLGVTVGQEFNVVVRRISSRQLVSVDRERPRIAMDALPPVRTTFELGSGIELNPEEDKPKPKAKGKAGDGKGGEVGRVTNWRYVVGTFQVRIPVSDREHILPGEENTLAIFKWRLQSMESTNRWRLVLERYVAYLSARVDGLGGDAASIEPSLTGVPPQLDRGRRRTAVYKGKVAGLIYDRFGDFSGFILDTDAGEETFEAREKETEMVVARAWAERIVTVVVATGAAPRRVLEIVLQAPPPPFQP